MEKNDFLLAAIKKINELPKNTKFLFKDLFTGIEWKNLPKKTRCDLGILFLNYVKDNKDTISIIIAEKTSSNQQQYIKI